MKLSLVIPIYNEAEGVTRTAQQLSSTLTYLRNNHDVEVILVDDGSQDATAARLEAAFAHMPGITIISHERNRGIGAALRTGFAQASGDVIITTDFDGTYPFYTIPQLVARLTVDHADAVIASPYHPHGSIRDAAGNTMRLGRAASLLYRIIVSPRIYSWTSLFAAYRREALGKVTFESSGALASTELLVNLVRGGFRVEEVPFNVQRRTFGRSRITTLRLIIEHVPYLLRLPVPLLVERISSTMRALEPEPSTPAHPVKDN